MSAPPLLTSKANPRFKSLRAQLAAPGLKRTHTLLLGTKLIQAWIEVRHTPAGARFRRQAWLRLEGEAASDLERHLELPTTILSDSLMRDLSDMASPPTLALLATLAPDPSGPLGARVILPWGIQDPGNLGAILRSGAAFGFQEAVLGPGCADPFSPKALRGSMGAAFLMPLRRWADLTLDAGRWIALEGGPQSHPMAEVDLRDPIRILVGNEGHGWRHTDMPPAVLPMAIPILGLESLNAAVAAGIACYEVARRAAIPPP